MPYHTLPCHAVPSHSPTLSRPALPCHALPRPALPCPALPCPVMPWVASFSSPDAQLRQGATIPLDTAKVRLQTQIVVPGVAGKLYVYVVGMMKTS